MEKRIFLLLFSTETYHILLLSICPVEALFSNCDLKDIFIRCLSKRLIMELLCQIFAELMFEIKSFKTYFK